MFDSLARFLQVLTICVGGSAILVLSSEVGATPHNCVTHQGGSTAAAGWSKVDPSDPCVTIYVGILGSNLGSVTSPSSAVEYCGSGFVPNQFSVIRQNACTGDYSGVYGYDETGTSQFDIRADLSSAHLSGTMSGFDLLTGARVTDYIVNVTFTATSSVFTGASGGNPYVLPGAGLGVSSYSERSRNASAVGTLSDGTSDLLLGMQYGGGGIFDSTSNGIVITAKRP
jgi:hypothetical protein